MELYILDSLLRRTTVVDVFQSLIWTERFNDVGDFELVIQSTPTNRQLLKPGTNVVTNESYRIMKIETVEDKYDSEGRSLLTVSGRSFEAVLKDRVAKKTLSGLETESTWSHTDTPGNIVRTLFRDICILGNLDPADVLPFVVEGSIFPEDTISEPSDVITVEHEPSILYDVIKSIADAYDLGFRFARDFDTSKVYFDVYVGSDRTTQQNLLPAVVFSKELDNLQNTTALNTTAGTKNVAYVFSPVGFEVVYPLNVDPDVDGFERQVLLVRTDSITTTDPVEASRAMIQLGREELAKNRSYSAFDGELNQNSAYKYGVHYNLGDLVELRNTDGATNVMRVTEQIFVSDAEGDRAYPTLAISQFITPGTWLSWKSQQVWQDVDPDIYWVNASD